MIKRVAPSNIYIAHSEQLDLLDNLSMGELKVYSYLKFAPLRNQQPESFKADALATALSMAPKSVRNNLTNLRKKGYAVVEFFKDERKDLVVKVVVGKDQVELYNLGLNVQINDAQTYTKLLEKFPLTDVSIPLEERKALIDDANAYARTLTAKGNK